VAVQVRTVWAQMGGHGESAARRLCRVQVAKLGHASGFREARPEAEGGAVMNESNLSELQASLREAEEQLRIMKELREDEHGELLLYRQYAKGMLPTFGEHRAMTEAMRLICASPRWAVVRSWYEAMSPEERKAYEVLELAAKRGNES
jgi:hypothetical protein